MHSTTTTTSKFHTYVKKEPTVGRMTTQHGDSCEVTNGLGSTNGGTLSGDPATWRPQLGHSDGTRKHATNEPGSQC